MLSLSINGQMHHLDIEPETPMLWVLRDEIGLTGTKFGCGIAQCGACTIHVDGDATRSCQFSAGDAVGKTILTIEGLGAEASARRAEGLDREGRAAMRLLPVRARSWRPPACSHKIPRRPTPTSTPMITNICRCGTYPRIRARDPSRRRTGQALRRRRHERRPSRAALHRRQPLCGRRPRHRRRPAGAADAALPLGPRSLGARSTATPNEVNAFVVVEPDGCDPAAHRQVRNGPGRHDRRWR